MDETPYAVPAGLVTEPMKASGGPAVAFLAVLGTASVMSAAFVGANAGATVFPTVTGLGEARLPDSDDARWAVAWLALVVLASSGIAPIHGRASSIVARSGLGLCGVIMAFFAWAGAGLWASLPFVAEGCSGSECWPSWAVGWSNSSPFLLTGLVMIGLAVFCRSNWVRRIVPTAVLLIAVVGYGFLWDEYLFELVSGPAPTWFVHYSER